MNEKLKNALFEARPYVEYWDRLREFVGRLWDKTGNEKEFVRVVKAEIEEAKEPFKTDLRIFLQKFEGL
ncbi:hypothetical protein [Thermococcus sp.]|uniref:hypothetical protein n=1 Tax=Thermococcus sp. TaxID=35749 RepID=UPI0025FA5CB4|nr:hypothetical protein [Thermococcus sp.]